LKMLTVTLAAAAALLFISIMTCIFATARFLTIMQPLRGSPGPRRRGKATHLMVILGSGGHTAEMLAMLKSIDPRSYTHRTYVVSEGDPLSIEKARKFEGGIGQRGAKDQTLSEAGAAYSISVVPRARKIHQSILTTPFSCLKTFQASLDLLRHPKLTSKMVPKAPDLILANGPATSAIIIFSSFILRFLDVTGEGHGQTRIVFIESMARIQSLSLSAKCVALFVDRLIVQWESLKGSGWGRAEYDGPIVVSSLSHG
jgi:beta-1,4-N-acetylglucosaminyltransferase